MEDLTREPCPWRIVDDAGAAFSMGCVGGAFFQGIKGFYNAPAGIRRRLMGGVDAVQFRASSYGGNFALFGAIFTVSDCTLAAVRQKEDPWNSIMSGFSAAALCAARAGPTAMIGSGILGGFLLALIEGVQVMFTRISADNFQPPLPPPIEEPPQFGSSPQFGMPGTQSELQ